MDLIKSKIAYLNYNK